MKSLTTREKALVLVFLLAMAWGAWSYRHLIPGAARTGAMPRTASLEVSPADTTAGPPASEYVVVMDSAMPEWGADPFNRPWRSPDSKPATRADKKQALWLSAIVVRPTHRYAVINGRIVREGEEVAGRWVTRIEASKVLVDDGGVEVTLTL